MKRTASVFLTLIMIVSMALPGVTAAAETKYVSKTFGDITFQHESAYKAVKSGDSVSIEFSDGAYVVISRHKKKLSDFSKYDRNAYFSDIGGVYEKLAAVKMGKIRKTEINGGTAYQTMYTLKNGKEPLKGSYKIDDKIFIANNRLYSIGYAAPSKEYDKFSEKYQDIVESIKEVKQTAASSSSSSSASSSGTAKVKEQSGTVYWTPNGEVWHSIIDCRSLARSKNIKSGTVAESGKKRSCNNCVR